MYHVSAQGVVERMKSVLLLLLLIMKWLLYTPSQQHYGVLASGKVGGWRFRAQIQFCSHSCELFSPPSSRYNITVMVDLALKTKYLCNIIIIMYSFMS